MSCDVENKESFLLFLYPSFHCFNWHPTKLIDASSCVCQRGCREHTNSVITRDHFPIIFLPKHFLCWKCYENLRNYDKNTIFKNKFLLYFLNIKVIYVHHRRNKQAKRGNENHPNPSHRENPHSSLYAFPSSSFSAQRPIFLSGLPAQRPIL